MKDLVIFGAGGLGREVMFQIGQNTEIVKEYNVLGFIDDTIELKGKQVNGYPIIGDTEHLLNYEKNINVVICLGNPEKRKNVYDNLKQNINLEFPNILASGVNCSEHVKMGYGCIICSASILTVNITIGNFVLIGCGCILGHDVAVADFATIYPSVTVSGNVEIGSLAEIGVGTKIIEKKKIGENAVIGGGATVITDIPACTTAVGVPAKIIKYH